MVMTLQQISDRFEIQDLLVAYSYAIDTRDWDALDGIFTPDAWIDYTAAGGPAGDLASTKEFLRTALPNFAGSQHMISTSQVRIDGDTAHVRTICHNPMVLDRGEGATHVLFIGLWYVDDLVRTEHGWRIGKRVEEVCYFHNTP